jgi:hypothetical protein
MSATKHTAGTWKARGGGYNSTPREKNRADMMDWCSGVDAEVPFTETDGSRGDIQTVASCRGRTLDEAEANARLIAAAPDLLDALRLLVELLDRGQPPGNDDLEQAHAAIAKATGGSA